MPIGVATLREACVEVSNAAAYGGLATLTSSAQFGFFPPAAAATPPLAAPTPPLPPQGNFSSTTGLVTLFMMLLSGQVFKSYGWGTAAKATPVVLLVTGVREAERDDGMGGGGRGG